MIRIVTAAEARMKEVMDFAVKTLPPGTGITFVLYEKTLTSGKVGYISNAPRPFMRRSMHELLAKWDSDAADSLWPLTLEYFDKWLRQRVNAGDSEVLKAIGEYREFSNKS